MVTSMQILGINHIGLAPKDPAKARWFFTEALALPLVGEELVAAQQTQTTMIASFTTPPHDPHERLEILEPEPGTDGPISKFLAKKGSGIHHVALSVRGIDAILVQLAAKGVRLIDATPRAGAHHTRIAFVHPESTGGLLVELVEERAHS